MRACAFVVVLALALPASAADPYGSDSRPRDPVGPAQPQAPEARKPAAGEQVPATSATPPRDRGSRDGEPPSGDTVPGGPSAAVQDPKRSDGADKQEGAGGAGSTGGKTY
jgi:hypothetical protein